jgi:glycerol-3-phosphate acyltransferase PlsY
MISLAALLLAYVLGSLSGSLILGRLRGVDIRTQGSGNAGGTNAFRTQGFAFALGTVVIDIGKGALAAWIGGAAIEGDGTASLVGALCCGLACAIGHIWPVFFGFRGGKGAAVLMGALAVCAPWGLLPLFGVWLLSIGLTGYVGLSTVLAGCALVPAALLVEGPERTPLLVAAGLTAALLAFTHRGNLQRLRRGTEHRFEKARVLVPRSLRDGRRA